MRTCMCVWGEGAGHPNVRLCISLGSVDFFKLGKGIVRVRKISLVALWKPREGTGLDQDWGLR